MGRWRITEMDLWDSEDLDLAGPAFIEFDRDQGGCFGFVAVEATVDCREMRRGEAPGVEFTWDGFDDSTPVSGRGWATLEKNGSLRGHIFFHLGDDSGFLAVKSPDQPTPRTATAKGGSRRRT